MQYGKKYKVTITIEPLTGLSKPCNEMILTKPDICSIYRIQ